MKSQDMSFVHKSVIYLNIYWFPQNMHEQRYVDRSLNLVLLEFRQHSCYLTVATVSKILVAMCFEKGMALMDELGYMNLVDHDFIILIKLFQIKSNILWRRDPHILDLGFVGCRSTYLGSDIILM